jgi:hypothetical protein
VSPFDDSKEESKSGNVQNDFNDQLEFEMSTISDSLAKINTLISKKNEQLQESRANPVSMRESLQMKQELTK